VSRITCSELFSKRKWNAPKPKTPIRARSSTYFARQRLTSFRGRPLTLPPRLSSEMPPGRHPDDVLARKLLADRPPSGDLSLLSGVGLSDILGIAGERRILLAHETEGRARKRPPERAQLRVNGQPGDAQARARCPHEADPRAVAELGSSEVEPMEHAARELAPSAAVRTVELRDELVA
jgi:hypothetical protein